MQAHRRAAWAAAPAALALVTWAGWAAGSNPTSTGFLYLVAVLGLATWGGWAVGASASVLAMLCLNFFFLPPFHTFVVADPSNWVALVSFLAASALASRLVATARQRAEEAQRRQREVETLYDLCFSLFAASQKAGALGDVTVRVVQGLGARAGRLFLTGAGGRKVLASAVGDAGLADDDAALARAWETRQTTTARDARTVYLPLHVGGRFYGVLAAEDTTAPRALLDPAARLLALAIERERLLAQSAHLEAVRESEALKTSLLRAVSHDLRTPLTAMRLEIESLERALAAAPQALPGLRNLAVEQARLSRRIDNLLAAARLEAGLARPHPEPTPVGALFRSARESLAPLLAGREVAVRVTPDCPEVQADPSLTLEALVNLLENAARATPANHPLELAATRDPHDAEKVRLEVLDRGPGLPEPVRRLLGGAGEREAAAAGDTAAGGLGLRIARSFAEAGGGSLALLDRPGGGTLARLTLPAVPEPVLVEETR
jgi:two-component system, OmpR family, sensor histidine kinase KdpD